MSREVPQKPAEPLPWYYRDIPVWIIAAAGAAAAVTFCAVEFRPVRTAPPVTVAAHSDALPPWKAILPDHLPGPSLPDMPPPAIPPPVPSHFALEAILPQAPPAPPHSPPPPLAIRYSVLKRLPDGSFTAVAPPQELAGNERAAIRFESSDAGFLTVFEQSPIGWQKAFSSEMSSSSTSTFEPSNAPLFETGSRQFLILFSRHFENTEPSGLDTLSPANPEDSPQPGFIVRATPQSPELLAFTLTLNYSLRP
ncbi:MAG TPA: hypothetical protein VKV17_03210 [Bryobacteraceae bacterium]|nr:hypothetical protein [Bryobacteraceae bacterium]